MSSILIGIVAIAVGALFCFRGIITMRFVITLWGAFVGFNLGSGAVAALTNTEFVATALGWIAGIALALVFAVLAYLYYSVAVILALASVGFVLGATAMIAANVTWNWVIIGVGVLVGIALGAAAIYINLPAALLVIISSIGGAIVIVAGIMLIVGTITTDQLQRADVTARINDSWWWYVAMAALAIAGVAAQLKMLAHESEPRAQWETQARVARA